MIAIGLALAVAANSPQAQLDELLTAKAAAASPCPLTAEYTPFCHPARVALPAGEARRVLQLIQEVDADEGLCEGDDAEACLQQLRDLKALRLLGWCTVTASTMLGAADVLWARCSLLPHP